MPSIAPSPTCWGFAFAYTVNQTIFARSSDIIIIYYIPVSRERRDGLPSPEGFPPHPRAVVRLSAAKSGYLQIMTAARQGSWGDGREERERSCGGGKQSER